MLRRFLDKLRGDAPRPVFDAPVEVPHRLYAIGDVHGSARLLEDLVSRILSECRAEGVTPRIVMMGDYVDRGDDSRQVLDLLGALAGDETIETVMLAGNHERLLLDFVDGRDATRRWLRFGGLQTLLSYGVGGGAVPGAGGDEQADEALRESLAEAMGPHLDFLRGLEVSHRAGNVFFAHAGADPEVPIELQPEKALIWGAPKTLEMPREDGIWVVHGHFIVDAPDAAQGRIAIDTGAYFSQRLTAACLEGDSVRFLSTADRD